MKEKWISIDLHSPYWNVVKLFIKREYKNKPTNKIIKLRNGDKLRIIINPIDENIDGIELFQIID